MAALVIEGYLAGPALFLGGCDARHVQRPFFDENRLVYVALADGDPAARCEIDPSAAPPNGPDRPKDEVARSFEFAILDQIVRSLELEPANGSPVDESPAWSRVAGAISSRLSRTVEQIGSSQGRGSLRIVEVAKSRRTMQAFLPIKDVAHAFAQRTLPMIAYDDETFENGLQPDAKFLERFDPACLADQPPLAAQATALGFLWMARLYQEHHRPGDDDDYDVLITKVKELSELIKPMPAREKISTRVKRTAKFAISEMFRDQPGLVARAEVFAARLPVIQQRTKLKPFANDARSISNLDRAIQRLEDATRSAALRLDEARWMNVIFDNSEALNRVRRDLAKLETPDPTRLRARVTNQIEGLWDQFFEIARGWSTWDVESDLPDQGEFIDQLHNYASFRGLDEDSPDNLKLVSRICRAKLLPHRGYDINHFKSAASSIPRPSQLQYSLEVAASVDSRLARSYADAGFKRDASEHAGYAFGYLQALGSMPDLRKRITDLVPCDTKVAENDAGSAANVVDTAHRPLDRATRKKGANFDDAQTAANISAYAAIWPILPRLPVEEEKEEFKLFFKAAHDLATAWARSEEGAGTALAHKIELLPPTLDR
jgi:hypothetical protein